MPRLLVAAVGARLLLAGPSGNGQLDRPGRRAVAMEAIFHDGHGDLRMVSLNG
jgi:hypothetical protein